MSKKVLESLDALVKVQCADGNWDYDPYMHGFANGLILAKSLFENKQPEYLDAPKVWGRDRPDAEKKVREVSAWQDQSGNGEDLLPGTELKQAAQVEDGLGQVVADVCQELSKQREKWGEQNHTPEWWLAILGEEVGEANKACLEAHFAEQYPEQHANAQTLADYRREMIQVAAVAISAVECLDKTAKDGKENQ